ncbi:ribosomal protein L34 [Lactiplantibacillus plantarum JDM1]|nr:ribosomal protein L34 [Lactiplantibacillus plantarum JDM1]
MQTILFCLVGVDGLTLYGHCWCSSVCGNHVHVDDGASLVGKFSSS